MTWSENPSFGRRGYHHGNLREALIDATLGLIAERGPTGFTVTEAARRAGVSPAAPYRHFRDAEALLSEVALRGFERFAGALTRAWNDGRPDPWTAFQAMGKAYLDFATAQPAYYAAMFETQLSMSYPELSLAADRAFHVLRGAAEQLCGRIPKPDRPPALMVALHVWVMSHGIASLFARPDKARKPIPMEPHELLEAAVLVYFRGLGLIGGGGDKTA